MDQWAVESCRACLHREDTTNMYTLGVPETMNLFNECTYSNISISDDNPEDAPQYLCSMCYRLCELWQSFRKRCQETEKSWKVQKCTEESISTKPDIIEDQHEIWNDNTNDIHFDPLHIDDSNIGETEHKEELLQRPNQNLDTDQNFGTILTRRLIHEAKKYPLLYVQKPYSPKDNPTKIALFKKIALDLDLDEFRHTELRVRWKSLKSQYRIWKKKVEAGGTTYNGMPSHFGFKDEMRFIDEVGQTTLMPTRPEGSGLEPSTPGLSRVELQSPSTSSSPKRRKT